LRKVGHLQELDTFPLCLLSRVWNLFCNFPKKSTMLIFYRISNRI